MELTTAQEENLAHRKERSQSYIKETEQQIGQITARVAELTGRK